MPKRKGQGIKMIKEMYCIICPNGCCMKVAEQGIVVTVEGNGCDRGAAFAEAEMTNPMRSLTTTVRTSFPEAPLLPVRTDGEIPKELIKQAMRELNELTIGDELDCGDTVIRDLAGSGVQVIATSDVLLRSNYEYEKRNSGLEGFGGASTGASAGGIGIVRGAGRGSDVTGDPWYEENLEVLDVDDMFSDDDDRDFLSAAGEATEDIRGKKGRSHIRRN
jgi:CxxC motif-containing protein